MTNEDTQATWEYHDATKHSHLSVRTNAHWLDWSNHPNPFKIYPKLEPIRLDPVVARNEVPALAVVAETGASLEIDNSPDLKSLSQLLYFSAGVVKKVDYASATQYFRAASCTGALYEIELYIVCGTLPGLSAGVYQFGPGDFSLRRLREGDFRGVLLRATANNPAVARAPATIICTGTYWRNAWKYQARAYRHFGWDNGTILANMLAIAASLRLPAQVTCGFVDRQINQLLDLDTEREVAFSMIPLGSSSDPPPPPPEDVRRLNLETVPVSESETHYPEMSLMHEASSLQNVDEVVAWREGMPIARTSPSPNQVISLSPLPDDEISNEGIESVILRRGSTRQFARVPLTLEQLSTMLDRSMRGIPADFLDPLGSQLNSVYLIVNAVDGIEPGSYVYHRGDKELERLKQGEFRGVAAHLGLDQQLPGDASVAVFLLAEIKPILERFGNRGYRAVQLEAGIICGKLYLAAYAQRLGATGLTFYDDEVIEFFSPHAAGKSAIFLMALGKSVKRK